MSRLGLVKVTNKTKMALAAMIVTLVIAVASLLIYAFYPSKKRRLINKIPGPPGLPPPIGHANQFKLGGSDFYEQVLQYVDDYFESGIIKIWIGPLPSIGVYHANTVEKLLNSSKHIEKSPEYEFLHPWLGTGLLTSTGAKWKIRRKLLTPTFHFKILLDFLQVFNEQTDIMVQKLCKKADGTEFDIFPFITMCALDIICETAMGTNVNAQANSNSEYVTAVYKMSELVHKRQKQPWFWPDITYNTIGHGRLHDSCLKVLHSFTEKVIHERSAELDQQLADHKGKLDLSNLESDRNLIMGKRQRLAFLDMLLYAAKGGASLSSQDIREEVDTFMFEGHDTTAAAASWAVHLIGANPDVQEKLHEEMDRIFENDKRAATAEDIKEMKYLDQVIKEQLRLFPSVPLFARTITEDCEIGGYTVPKGTTAIVVTSCLHRDPKYFPDPEKFDPERWTPDKAAQRHPYSYVPFSAGLRNCIGQKFAQNEEKVLLSSILRNFHIESTQTREELHPMGELILRPEHGIKVKLTPRIK